MLVTQRIKLQSTAGGDFSLSVFIGSRPPEFVDVDDPELLASFFPNTLRTGTDAIPHRRFNRDPCFEESLNGFMVGSNSGRIFEKVDGGCRVVHSVLFSRIGDN